MSKEITGALFKQMILHGAAAITAQKQAINDLYVFPVPDGDTGTNMSMTIATAAEALRKAAPASVGQASSVTASALLQGARFQAACPDAEISVLSGGQPVYYYIISFE